MADGTEHGDTIRLLLFAIVLISWDVLVVLIRIGTIYDTA